MIRVLDVSEINSFEPISWLDTINEQTLFSHQFFAAKDNEGREGHVFVPKGKKNGPQKVTKQKLCSYGDIWLVIDFSHAKVTGTRFGGYLVFICYEDAELTKYSEVDITDAFQQVEKYLERKT